jgi:hypothetical protein
VSMVDGPLWREEQMIKQALSHLVAGMVWGITVGLAAVLVAMAGTVPLPGP